MTIQTLSTEQPPTLAMLPWLLSYFHTYQTLEGIIWFGYKIILEGHVLVVVFALDHVIHSEYNCAQMNIFISTHKYLGVACYLHTFRLHITPSYSTPCMILKIISKITYFTMIYHRVKLECHVPTMASTKTHIPKNSNFNSVA